MGYRQKLQTPKWGMAKTAMWHLIRISTVFQVVQPVFNESVLTWPNAP